MSSKEELEATSKALKDSIEDQFDEMKEKVQKAGKIGLAVGGGLLAVLLVSQLFSSDEKKEEQAEETTKKKKKSKVVRQIARSNFLGNSLKEQAILFALGLAAKQLKTFITDLNNSNDKEGSE
jgi:VIT1/CCC1 family predicted Fe2+/Mn2+ transporter